ncbi:MAG: C39 family peptidase [Kofleriaceae bacterium]
MSQTTDTKEELAAISELGNEISKGEGGYKSYNTGTANNKVIHSGIKENMFSLTVDQLHESSKRSPYDRERVFAAGKYQIITDTNTGTLVAAKQAMKLSGNEKFTPELQEKIFMHFLIGPIKRPVMHAYIENGKGSVEDAVYDAAKEWASIEVPNGRKITGGRVSNGKLSYYESGKNHAKLGSGAKVRAKLEAARAAFASAQNGGGTKLETQTTPSPIIDESDEQTSDETTETKPEVKTDERVETQTEDKSDDKPTKLIAHSVGKHGKNHKADVGATQQALETHGHSPGKIDKLVGPKTIGAIESFQATFMKQPDGLVEAGKKTEQHLLDGNPTKKPETTEETTETKPEVKTETKLGDTSDDKGDGDGETVTTQDASLGQLLAKPRLTTAELAEARQLIAKEPAAKRAELYRTLQTKVMYANQRDNKATLNGKLVETGGGEMCNLTSLAMCLAYLGIPNPHPEMQYEDALEKVRQDKKFAARTDAQNGWGAVARFLGAKVDMIGGDGTHPRTWWKSKVGGALAAGRSVMCSITGHIVRIQSVEEDGLVVDDPYSRRTLLPGGKGKWKSTEYNAKTADGKAGEDVTWTWDQVEPHSFHWVAAFSK